MIVPNISMGNYMYPNYWNYGFQYPQYSPNFRGDTIVTSPQYNPQQGIMELPKDTVEMSASNKIKGTKKNEMPTATKIALGVIGTAGTIYAGIVGHRMLNKPTLEKCAQNFSEIFRRDVSKDEAQKIIGNYQELFKIKDNEEFCKKAFEQVKKDYGYEKLDIPLIIKNITGNKAGGWAPREQNISTYINIEKPFSLKEKQDELSKYIHEFQHVKQDEIAYRTNPDKFNLALKEFSENPSEEKILEDFKGVEKVLNTPSELKEWAQKANMSVKEYKKELEEILKNKDYKALVDFNIPESRKNLDKLFSSFKPLNENSEEYQLGIRYIDNNAHYIHPEQNKEKYYAQILEREAYATEKKLTKILGYKPE